MGVWGRYIVFERTLKHAKCDVQHEMLKTPPDGPEGEKYQCSFSRGRITRLIRPTSIIRPVLK